MTFARRIPAYLIVIGGIIPVIAADPADTPKHLYSRIGFRPVAIATHHLKKLGEP